MDARRIERNKKSSVEYWLIKAKKYPRQIDQTRMLSAADKSADISIIRPQLAGLGRTEACLAVSYLMFLRIETLSGVVTWEDKQASIYRSFAMVLARIHV